MSSISNVHNSLFRVYEHYVGEPDSKADVYGYWLFLFGFIVSALATTIVGAGYALLGDDLTVYRIGGTLGGIGLSFMLFGIVMMLPTRKRGIQVSFLGLLVGIAGSLMFAYFYPSNIRVQAFDEATRADYTLEVVGVYAAGVGLVALVTALVPVLTGQRGMLVEEEGATDDPAILTGDSLDGAQFAVFRDENGDWKWHVLHLEALASSESSAETRPEAEELIDTVKAQIGSAGLMELTTSAFRLYETREGDWQWTLVRDDGSVVAECADLFEQRSDAEESVSFLKDRGPDADVIEIEGAAFTYYEERDHWHWELLDDDRNALATSETGFRNQGRAEEAARTFADHFDTARLLDIEHVGVELWQESEEWLWRLIDDTDEIVAKSADMFDSRRDAEKDAESLLPQLESAAITVAGEPTYELYEDDEWVWRLVDENEHVVARTPEPSPDHGVLEAECEAFSEHALSADVVEIDGADYEVYPTTVEVDPSDEPGPDADDTVDSAEVSTDGGVATERAWNWRLVTDDRDIVAASDEPHGDPDAATNAIHRVREQANEADLIEFEQSAFQVYEADSGEWRWRLIDEDGNVLADSGAEHTSRTEAAEAMMTLKEQAPDAELLEIDTAAFELFVDEGDEWGWRLIDAGGKLVAEDPNTHPTRDEAKQAMDRLLDALDSDIRTMDEAIFQTYVDEDWHWQFVLASGEVVAVNEEARATRDELVEVVEDIRDDAASGQPFTIGEVSMQVYESSGVWSWRLLDRDRGELADAEVTYDDRETVLSAVEKLSAHAPNAPVFTIEDAAILLDGDGGWTWDLVDRDREQLGTAVESEATKGDAKDVVDEVKKLAPMAGRVDFDVASFELYADAEDRWSWRLLNEDGRTVATSTQTYESTDAIGAALDSVRDLIGTASILEIDSVSFELHAAEEEDEGWRWKLVDRYGRTLSESTKVYESRTDARDAMTAVKEHAPEGWITFTD